MQAPKKYRDRFPGLAGRRRTHAAMLSAMDDGIGSVLEKLRPARTKNFDEEFLEFLDSQRKTLGSDLLRNNDRADLLEGTRLNEAVQCILDRLLFIRISEARGIDMGTKLQSFLEIWENKNKSVPMSAREEPPAGWGGTGLSASRGTLWNSIVRQIRGLDRRPQSEVPYFNGNIFKFHFRNTICVINKNSEQIRWFSRINASKHQTSSSNIKCCLK